MTDRFRRHPYPPDDQPGRSPREAGSSASYTPDRRYYTPPIGSPPRPKTFIGRVTYSLRNYLGLRTRAGASSMHWWLLKLVQGLVLATPPGITGIGLVVGGSLADSGQCIGGIGKALVLASVLVFLWYALAPITQRWRVTIPEGAYWVVEDSAHYTLDFLAGGRQPVDWHWNARIVEYANFTRVSKSVRVDGVFVANNQRVSLDAHVVMLFNPALAPRDMYPELRKMTRPDYFAHQIDRYVRGTVLETLQRRSDRLYLINHPSDLAGIVHQSLEELAEWGLFPLSSRPVSIQVTSAPLPDAGPLAQPPAPPPGYTYDEPHQPEIPTQPGPGPVPPQPTAGSSPDADTVVPDTAHAPSADHDAPTLSGTDERDATHSPTRDGLDDPMDRRRKDKKKRRREN